MLLKVIFWTAAAFVLYTYAGYPVLLWLVQLIFRRPLRKEDIQPSVSLLISAYNEEHVIAAKLRNSLALDYPAEKLEIVIASDGSTDSTAQIARLMAEREGQGRIHLLEFAENRGKVVVLNDAVPRLGGEIVVFSDASSMLQPNALRELVSNFADARVGAVSGVYQVLNRDGATLGRQEDFYWKYETFIKLQEAKLGTLTGAHGCLHAIRKALYPFPPAGTINDDFVIPTSVLKRGFWIAYETNAISSEEAQEMAGFGRRVRIMAGNIEQMGELKAFFWPPRPFLFLCFLSHKGARILSPLAMLVVALSNLLLWQDALYRWLLGVQAVFYGLAALGALGWLKPKILRLPFYFCMINAALFVLLYRWLFPRSDVRSAINKTRELWHES
jgi:glycosyltransferase involved in cell wall biosynthesis